MPERSRSALHRVLVDFPRLLRAKAAQAERGLRDYFRQTTTRRRLSRSLSVVLFACMSLVIMGDNGCSSCYEYALEMGIPPFFLPFFHLFEFVDSAAKFKVGRMLVGTDGSQTGVASFLGNATVINQPTNTFFVLQRQTDCSLNYLTATSSLTGSATVNGAMANYERTLHQLAGLTTTADVYPKGCVEKTLGISTRPGVYVGQTVGGFGIFAAAAGNGNGNAVHVLQVSADFSAIKLTAQATLSAATGLAVADLNKDGNHDLVVVNSYNPTSSYVSVMLGNADGTFQTPVNYPTSGAKSVAAVIDDINGDGKLDILVATDDQHISVLTGKGDGSFNAAQSFAATTPSITNPIVSLITDDFNGDGKKDILGSNGLVLLGNNDGTFMPLSAPAFPYAAGSTSNGPNLASGDINGDGKLDVVRNTGDVVSIWLGKGDGTFSPGPSYASIGNSGYVTVNDLDGDGNLDIYTGLANGGLYSGDDSSFSMAYVLMGKGDGTFLGAPSISSAYNGTNLGDVNGDGIPDLISTNASIISQSGSTPTVFTVQLGNGKGGFTASSTITVPDTFSFPTNSTASGTVTIVGASTVSPTSYAVSDINGDGHADLVFVDNNLSGINQANNNALFGYTEAVFFVALNNGDGTFKTPVAYPFPQIAPANDYDNQLLASNLQLADTNGDGHPDLIASYSEIAGLNTNHYNIGVAVVLGNGDGTFKTTPVLTPTFASPTAPTSAAVPSVVGISNLNGDHYADLLISNSSFAIVNGFGVTTATLQAYTGKGDGSFNASITIVTSNKLGSVAVADFNQDGKLDIATVGEALSTQQNTAQGQLFIALGNGNGTFGTPTTFQLSGGDLVPEASLVAADFDGDGKVDLAYLGGPNASSGVFYGKGDGSFVSVPNGNIYPKDLINLGASGAAIAVDLNNDAKPDILIANTVLINTYGNTIVTAPIATTTAVTASPATGVSGTSVTLTATVTGASGSTGTPSGTVTFFDGSTSLGTGTLGSGKATFTTTSLSVATHSITVVYAGDSSFSGSTSSAASVIIAAPVVSTTTTLSATATSAVSGTGITFTAQVSPASGTAIPAGTITFADGATTLGMVSLDGTGKAAYTTSALAVGSHTIMSSYAGTSAFGGSVSNGLGVTITAASVPDFVISVSPASSTVARGSSVMSTLTITPVNGFNLATALACTGAPSGATCTISPNSVTPNGTSATTATVTLQTSASAQALPSNTHRNFAWAATLPVGLLGTTALFGIGMGRRRHLPLLLTMLATFTALVAITGCSHHGSSSSTNTPTTYTLNLSGTSGSTTHTTTWTVTAQ